MQYSRGGKRIEKRLKSGFVTVGDELSPLPLYRVRYRVRICGSFSSFLGSYLVAVKVFADLGRMVVSWTVWKYCVSAL